MKVSELAGAQLDYWVGKAEGLKVEILCDGDCVEWFKNPEWDCQHDDCSTYAPSRRWEHGGPIIERERINVSTPFRIGAWLAEHNNDNVFCSWGATPLEASMRCYVASKFGYEVSDE